MRRGKPGSRPRLARVLRLALPPDAPAYQSPALITATGVVASTALAVGADATGGSGVAGLGFGLAATVVALQIDVLAQLARRQRGDDADSKLLADLDETPWLRHAFQAIARAAAAQDFATTPILATLAESRLRRTCELFERLSPGRYESEPDNHDLITLMDSATESVHAVTIMRRELEYWRSHDGREYWAANRRAMIERGVSINRIFVAESGANADLDNLAREQAEAGVQVWTVEESSLPSHLVDYILIFDDQWSQRIDVSVGGRPTRYWVEVEPADIDRAGRRFDEIRRLSARQSRFPEQRSPTQGP